LLQEVTGRGRREQFVTGQQIEVVLGPLEHVPLLVVVRDQGNLSPCGSRRVVGHANPLGCSFEWSFIIQSRCSQTMRPMPETQARHDKQSWMGGGWRLGRRQFTGWGPGAKRGARSAGRGVGANRSV